MVFKDATIAPIGKPYVEVVTIAKKDLKKGEDIDGIGYFTVYGECENSTTARKQNLLPLGLAEGCRLKKDIKKDTPLTFNDVEIPPARLIDSLWQKQLRLFSDKSDK